MSSFITIKGIGFSKHLTAKYVITPILFTGERNGKLIKVRLIKKAYIVQGLKVKILLKINIMGPKKFEISLITKKLYIDFYNVDV